MIAHIILFEPLPTLSSADRTRMLEAFTAATSAEPSVRSVRIGKRVKHGLPGYEQHMQKDYEYVAIVEFDDVEGLEAYLRNPVHASAGRHFTESASAALAYDYAIVPAAEARSLVSKNE